MTGRPDDSVLSVPDDGLTIRPVTTSSLTRPSDSSVTSALTWHRGFGTDRYAFARCGDDMIKLVEFDFRTNGPHLVLVQRCDKSGMPECDLGTFYGINLVVEWFMAVPV